MGFMLREDQRMAGFEIPQQLIFGGGLFLLAFFVFIVLYIIARLWAEKRGHSHDEFKKQDRRGKT